MHKILLLVFGVFIVGFRADGQVFDAGDCPRGPQVRIPITSLTKSPHSNMMVLTDSCRNQYYVHPDSVFTNGVIEQYFAGDTLITILSNGDTLFSEYQVITNLTYLNDTLCVETSTGDIFCTVITIDADTSGSGRFRLLDNFGTNDTLYTWAAPAIPDVFNITNALRLNPGQTIKWGGRLVDATTTVQSMDSTHNITYQDVNIMRHYGASMRFYPWDRFLVDGSPDAYIDMRSRTSFYVRADTVLHLDLFQHGLSDTSYLLIRTTRLRKGLVKQGSFLQLLQHTSGTYQGNADWSLYQFPLQPPPDTGLYILHYNDEGDFTWEESSGGEGPPGPPGPEGPQGPQGDPGVSVIDQYFSNDTLYTILSDGDTLISQYQMITNVTYLGDTLCIETSTGDVFCVEIIGDGDTTSNGRFRLLDNIGTMDSIHVIPSPASPETFNISNALRLNPGQTIKWGGRLVDATTTVQSMDSTHNITYQDVNIMRHYGASMRFYPWDRFLVDGSPDAYIDMRSRTSFYMRADTVMHLDLFQHGITDSSYLLIRTTRLRKNIAKAGAVLQLLQHASGTYQGNSDWTPYQLPLTSPVDTGAYVLNYNNGQFTFEKSDGNPLMGGTVLNSTLRWDGTAWVENDSLLVNAAGEAAAGGVAIQPTRSFTLPKDLEVNSVRVGQGGGTESAVLGQGALNSSGTRSVGIGFEAGQNQTGGNNTFVGWSAGKSVTTGSSKIAIGKGAMSLGSNKTGQYSIAIGATALDALSTANNNIGIGAYSLRFQTVGGSNIGIGHYALNALTGSGTTFNTALGTEAGRNSTGNQGTTFIGAGSGYNSTSSHSIFLGRNSGYSVTADSALVIQSTSDSVGTIVGHLGRKKVGINRSVNTIDRTLDVGGDLRVRNNVDTASLVRLWAGNPEGDLKRVFVGDGLGFVGDTLKVSYSQLQDDYPYIQAVRVDQYKDTIAASNSKIIKFNTQGNVKDWVLDSNWIQYQGLDTFMMKLDCNITLLADAATTFQITFHSDVWGELFGYEMSLNGGTQTLHVANHVLFPIPYIVGAQPSDERFSIWIKNTSANQRIFTVRSASLTAIRVGRWIPEFNP